MAAVKIIGKVGVKVMPDTTDFKDKLKRDLEKIERQIGDLKVDVVPQITQAAKKKVQAEMDRLQKQLDGKNVDFDLGLNKNDVAGVEAALALVARDRNAKINVDVDHAALRRAADSLLMLGGARPQIDGIRMALEKLGRLDYVAINTGVLATKITAVGAAALAATGHTISVGGGIASIAKAGLALPGLLGGIAVGLGTTAAAFADFNKYVPQAGDEFARLQNIISRNFWEQAATQINEFINGVFPILRQNLRTVSTELGNFFGSFAEALGTSLNPALDGMFKALAESIRIATKYVDEFANIITILGTAGTSQLPALAEWFGKISTQFSEFLTKAQADGSLQRWIDEGVTNLKALGSVIASTGSIFKGFYDAAIAAGGTTLVQFAENMRNVADAVNSSGFQSGLTTAFKAAFDTMSAITDGAGPGFKAFIESLVDTFAKVGPGLGDSLGNALGSLFEALSSPASTDGLLALFEGIQSAFDNLSPTIGPVVGMLASLGPVFAALLNNVTRFMSAGIDRLGPTFTGLATAVVPIINKLGDLFVSVFESLTPVFQQVGQNAIKLVGAFGPLIDAVQNLWNVIGPLLVPVLKIVADVIGSALLGVVKGVTMVFSGLTSVISGVVGVLKGVWNVIAGLFTFDFGRVADGFGQIFSGLGDIILGALEAAAGAIWAFLNGSLFGIFRRGFAMIATKIVGPIKNLFGPAWNWIVKGAEDGVTAVGGVFSRIVDVIKYPFQRIAEVVGPIITAGWNVIKAIFSGAFTVISTIIRTWWTVVSTIFKTAFEVIKVVVTTAWSVLTTIFSTAFNVIRTVIVNAWNGIKAFFSAAMEGLYMVFKGPWDAIADFLLALWTNIKVGAMLIWNSLRTFLNNFLVRTQVRIETVWNAIKGATSAVWNAIKGVVTKVWDGIRNAVSKVLDAVKSFIKSRWDNIKSNTTSVWNAIKSAISNVWNAIKSFVSNAINRVKETITNIWNTIKSNTSGTWNTIKSFISNAWNNIKSRVQSAASNVRSLMANAWDAIKSKVTSAWNSIKSTVVNKIGEVITQVKSIPGKARSALAGLGGVLINAGKELIGGLISGITSKIGEVKDTLTGLTGKLKDWKGPEPVDKVLLTPAGQLIMDGFIKGLESRYADVKESLRGLTKDIASDFDSGQKYRVGVAAELTTAAGSASVVDGITRTVSAGAVGPAANDSAAPIHIDNITIPLEDLKQLNTLEEFFDMLRVRTRQGVAL